MATKERRKYRGPDGAMLSWARTMHGNLTSRLAAFQARFSEIDAAWAAAFDVEIKAAHGFAPDDGLVKNKMVLTSDKNAVMEAGRVALQALGTYAGLAYREEPERKKVFGQSEWPKALRSRVRLSDALLKAHKMASQNPYQTDLTAKGYAPAEIAALKTLGDLLAQKSEPQFKAAKERRVYTADRIRLLNKVWLRMQTLHPCAAVVYRDQYAERRLFRMYEKALTVLTKVWVQVRHDGQPVTGATVMLNETKKKLKTTGAKGEVTYRSVSFPATVTGTVQHPEFGRKSFSLNKLKKGKRNRIVVSV